MSYTKDQIEKAVKFKNYAWFDSNTDYDLNIVGVRNSSVGKKVTNVFDDFITCSFKINNVWQSFTWSNTTDPGTKGVMEASSNGVARLVPGQYRNSHHIGLHKGQYKALVQLSNVTVYRDNNKDMVFDENRTETGIFGINIHHAGIDSTLVENWSEGCLVFKRIIDFNQFMDICGRASDIHGNHFTLTLIESKDII
jgi:hypothetical protein